MNRATQLDDCDSLADFMQIMHGSALLGNVHDEVYGPVHARVLLPPVSARVPEGCRVLPLTRTWHSLAHGRRAAFLLSRTV